MARNSVYPEKRQAIKRTLIIAAIAVIFIILLYFLSPVAYIFISIFMGMLFGVLLRGLASFLQKRTHLPHSWSLAIVILSLCALFLASVWFVGTPIVNQFSILVDRIPQAIESLRSSLMAQKWSRIFFANPSSPKEMLPSGGAVLRGLTNVFSGIVDWLANLILIFFIGIYTAARPELYIDSTLRLLPKEKRKRAYEVIGTIGQALRSWLIGRFAAMFVVGLLTAIGLLIVRAPLVLALTVIATGLSFIPFIGAILSAVPAVMVAFLVSPIEAGYVIIVFLVVHLVEGYLITPAIQQYVVSLPPAFLISVQILMAVLFGPLAILIAAPLSVAIIIMIQMLYIEDVLGDTVEIVGKFHLGRSNYDKNVQDSLAQTK